MVARIAASAARYAWVAPATLAGGALVILVVAFGGRIRIVQGVVEGTGGVLATWLAARVRFCAITLGHVVLALDERTAEACRAHERVHVRQYERWGGLFFAAYLAESAWQALRGGDAYHDNRFEREARRLAGG